jgi:hypothetical protein
MLSSLPSLEMLSVSTPHSLLSQAQREDILEEESTLISSWANCLPQICRFYVAHAYSEQYSEEDYYIRDMYICGRQEFFTEVLKGKSGYTGCYLNHVGSWVESMLEQQMGCLMT